METKLQRLRDLVLEKNQVLNLTAITDPAEFDLKHTKDSLMLLEYLDLSPGQRVADLGTGAGYPGLPLAITHPEVMFHLMDSVNKKLQFVQEAVNELELPNVQVHHGRFEDLAHEAIHREMYDVVVSRAVAALPVLLEYMAAFAKVGGYLACYKSQKFATELVESENARKDLNLRLKSVNKYSVGGAEHVLAIFEKMKPTPAKYPRQAGTPKRNPL